MEPLGKLEELGQFRMRLGLSRMMMLADALDDPQMKVPTVHIAGTNGKGSTASMVDSILSVFGVKRGLYTSPHLERITERLRFNGEEVSRGELSSALERIFDIAGDWDDEDMPTYFEALTAAFFLLSPEKGTDINIVEVGMGGRFDATNIVEPIASGITSISLDHQEHLGDHEFAIAREKAGIIGPSTPVVLGPIHRSGEDGMRALRVILDICTANGCPVIMITPPGHEKELRQMMISRSIPDGRIISVNASGDKASLECIGLEAGGPFSDRLTILDEVLAGDFRSPLPAKEQVFNMACALSLALLSLPAAFSHMELQKGRRAALSELIEGCTDYLLECHDPGEIRQMMRDGLSETVVRGRTERLDHAGCDLIFDGAHNPDAARAFADTVRSVYPEKRGVLLMAMMRDKDPISFLEPFEEWISSVVVTEVPSPRAMKARDVISIFGSRNRGDVTLHMVEDTDSAVDLWIDLAERTGLGLAGGTFYLYQPVMRHIRRPT